MLEQFRTTLIEEKAVQANDLAQKINQVLEEAKGEIKNFTRSLVDLIAKLEMDPKIASEAMRIFESEENIISRGLQRDFPSADLKILYFFRCENGQEKCIFGDVFQPKKSYPSERGKIKRLFLFKYGPNGTKQKITLNLNNKRTRISRISKPKV